MSFVSWVDLHVWSYISWRKKIEIIYILSFDSISFVWSFGLFGFRFILECSWEDLSNSRDCKVEKLYYATTIFHFFPKRILSTFIHSSRLETKDFIDFGCEVWHTSFISTALSCWSFHHSPGTSWISR